MPAQKLCREPEAAPGLAATQAHPRGAVLSSHSVPGPAVPTLTWGWSRSWRGWQQRPSGTAPTAAAGPCAPLGTGGAWTALSPALTPGTSCSHSVTPRAWGTAPQLGALASRERSHLGQAGCAPGTAGLRSAVVCMEQLTGAAPSLAVLSTSRTWSPGTLLCCSPQLCPLAGFPCTGSTSTAVSTASPLPSRQIPAMERACSRKHMPIPVPLTGTTGPAQLQGHPLPSK